MNLEKRTWKGAWISDPNYQFESPASPVPMMVRRRFSLERHASLEVFVTAMGVFDLYLDGQRLHDDYFSPGFTDYSAHLQYVRCEAADLPQGEHELLAVVAGGWAVGRSTHVDDRRCSAICSLSTATAIVRPSVRTSVGRSLRTALGASPIFTTVRFMTRALTDPD